MFVGVVEGCRAKIFGRVIPSAVRPSINHHHHQRNRYLVEAPTTRDGRDTDEDVARREVVAALQVLSLVRTQWGC